MTTKYALIGSGMMGQEHIRNVALLDGAEISAISDPDERMRNTAASTVRDRSGHQPATFDDYKSMLSSAEFDAVLLASPNDTHHAIMQDLIGAKKPVLCEKPLCTTSDNCRDLIAQANGSGALVWVAMEYRYMPPVQRLLSKIEAGTAGPAKMMSIREHRFPFLEKVGDWNRFNHRTGGTLVEKCCHFWDLMRLALKSEPVRVYASAAADVNHQEERYDGATPDIIDNAFVIVDFENGTRGMLDLCMFAEGSYWQEIISVTGPKARIDACVPGPARFSSDGKERHSQIVISDRETKREKIEPVHVDEAILGAGDHHGSTFFQHQKFLELVRTGRGTPDVSLHDGLMSVLIGEAAERSAREGRAVRMEEMQ
ncbi:MAG: Gfo/Idh/MocA family oxidoreductase [Pseudomonadota bacterium]